MAGSSRITVFCVQLTSSPRSRQACDDRRAFDRQLQADHQAQNPHFANQFARRSARAVSRSRNRSLSRRACSSRCSLLDHFDGGHARPGRRSDCRRTWPRACRAQAGSDFGRGQQGPAGNAAAQRLGQRHHVGRDAEVLIGEPLAGAAAAGLHFVEHQQNACCRRPARADLAESRRAE